MRTDSRELGTPYLKQALKFMTRIPDTMLPVVFYLYKSPEEAEKGEAQGGTGFFAAYPDINGDLAYCYAVTNLHVLLAGALTLRVNRAGSKKTLTIETKIEDWQKHPHGDDVAAYEIGFTQAVDFTVAPVDSFITEKRAKELDIGIGDDVYMIGRQAGVEGIKQNHPATRYGNISRMPDRQGIRNNALGIHQESYIC